MLDEPQEILDFFSESGAQKRGKKANLTHSVSLSYLIPTDPFRGYMRHWPSKRVMKGRYFITLTFLCVLWGWKHLWFAKWLFCVTLELLSLCWALLIFVPMCFFQLIESYKNGGSLLIQGPDHCSLLHYAAKTGNGEIVKYILDHGE